MLTLAFLLIALTLIGLYIFEKYTRVTWKEMLLISGLASAGLLITWGIANFSTSYSSTDTLLHTHYVAGKYYTEKYCYYRHHTETYQCGTEETPRTCTRRYTTYHHNPVEYFYSLDINPSEGKPFTVKAKTSGDGLCSGQERPNAIGNGMLPYSWNPRTDVQVNKSLYDKLSINQLFTFSTHQKNPIKNYNGVIFSVGKTSKEDSEHISSILKRIKTTDEQGREYRFFTDTPLTGTQSTAIPEALQLFNASVNKADPSVSVVVTSKPLSFYDSMKREIKNGSSNDFIILLFTQSGTVETVKTIHWGNESIKSRLEMYSYKGLTPYEATLKALSLFRSSEFTHKNFKEYDYIKAPVSTTALGICLSVVLIGIGILVYLAVHHDLDVEMGITERDWSSYYRNSYHKNSYDNEDSYNSNRYR